MGATRPPTQMGAAVADIAIASKSCFGEELPKSQAAEMSISLITLLFFALTVTTYTKVEGTVFLMPSLTNVILGKAVTLECYTYESAYTSLSFIFHTLTTNTKTSPMMQFNGGIRRTTTFTMTADLNATQLSCAASGANGAYNSSRIVKILVQDIPKQIFDVDICKLGRRVFFSWNPVFALLGINVSYIINDNYRHQNMTINKPHYFIQLNDELDYAYESSIVVMFNASAFNQVAYSEPKIIGRQLSGTNLKLNVSAVYLKNKDIQFDFISVLSDLNECSFNDLTDETLIACHHNDGSTCTNYSASYVKYQENKGELVFRSTLNSLRQKFNSSLCFDYIGVKIETDNAPISTHLIQNLNFDQRCVNFSILGDNEISVALYFRNESKEMLVHKFNVSKSSSCLYLPIVYNQTHNISFSERVGNWSVSVYDMSDEEEQRQPAVELHNIDVTVYKTIPQSPPGETSSEQTVSSSVINTATKLDVLLLICFFFWLMI